MNKTKKLIDRNFVAHATQTVRYNSGRHENMKRKNELQGRHAKHKSNYKQSTDCYTMLLTFHR